MSEWTIVSVLATLVGLVAAIIRPLMSLNGTITRLSEIVKDLDGDIKEYSEKNSKSHLRLWQAVDECEECIGRHETRLAIIQNLPAK